MTFVLRIPAGPRAPAAARHALEALADRIDPELLRDLQLVVSELVTNSFRHATPGGNGWVEVWVDDWPECVTLEVINPGGGFDVRPETAAQRFDRASGWGLFLVHQLASRWGVEGGRVTRVWCEFAGRGRRPRADGGGRHVPTLHDRPARTSSGRRWTAPPHDDAVSAFASARDDLSA